VKVRSTEHSVVMKVQVKKHQEGVAMATDEESMD